MKTEHSAWNNCLTEMGEPMPPDWEIQVVIWDGGASVELINPDGDVIDFDDDDDDLTVDEMLQRRVNHARLTEGMPKTF